MSLMLKHASGKWELVLPWPDTPLQDFRVPRCAMAATGFATLLESQHKIGIRMTEWSNYVVDTHRLARVPGSID